MPKPGVKNINYLYENCASCHAQVAFSCAQKSFEDFFAQAMDKLKLASTIFVQKIMMKFIFKQLLVFRVKKLCINMLMKLTPGLVVP
jgi:hypothetical protein